MQPDAYCAEASRSYTDLTRLVWAKRWCATAAWVGYAIGSLAILFALAIPTLWLLVAALFAASFALVAGSRIGATVHLVLVSFSLGYFIHDLIQMQESLAAVTGYTPSQFPWIWVGIFLVAFGLALMGVWASVVYQRSLPTGAPRATVLGTRWLVRLRISLHRPKLPQIVGCYALMALWFALLLLPAVLEVFLGWDLSTLYDWGTFAEPSWLFWAEIAVLGVALGVTSTGIWWLHTKAKRLRAVSMARLREVDPRAPVLLLRSFGDDLTSIGRRLPFTGWQPSFFHSRAWTLEEALERTMEAYGPVIAIGRPGEALPPAGAGREYLAGELWREHVEDSIDEAEFVVVIVGKTEGLVFEYGAINARRALGKLFLIFPPVDAAETHERWSRFCDVVDPGWRDLLPRDAQPVLTVRFAGGTLPEFVTCKWHEDEDSYSLALRYCAASGSAPNMSERAAARYV